MSVKEVQFSYAATGTGRAVVDSWCADFPGGSVTALTGPSGCGKSTRLYLLALMLTVGSGVIELDGQRVDNLSDARRSSIRAHRFGFVFQDAVLDPTRTVIDNIVESALYRGQPRRAAHHRGLRLIRQFSIEVPPHRRPGQISGGQAQRIALCRALVGRPDVLFADEPTGNLDPASASTVLTAFREHADRGGCVVVVTHDPSVARWADHHIVVGDPVPTPADPPRVHDAASPIRPDLDTA
ncbi:ATP-binding cassette domain-containing protein [Nakamurella silvestris]|nr:ATP-binding cassette domain-containing protein [Nakamurella silvestris]